MTPAMGRCCSSIDVLMRQHYDAFMRIAAPFGWASGPASLEASTGPFPLLFALLISFV